MICLKWFPIFGSLIAIKVEIRRRLPQSQNRNHQHFPSVTNKPEKSFLSHYHATTMKVLHWRHSWFLHNNQIDCTEDNLLSPIFCLQNNNCDWSAYVHSNSIVIVMHGCMNVWIFFQEQELSKRPLPRNLLKTVGPSDLQFKVRSKYRHYTDRRQLNVLKGLVAWTMEYASSEAFSLLHLIRSNGWYASCYF